MAEKELAILLTAKNMASGVLNRVKGDIRDIDSVSARAGRGVRTLGANLRGMALGAGVGITVAGFAAIKSGLDSLAERENVISATTAAIEAQGSAATVSAGQVRNWSEELERATGAAVDDKAIQASANTLIRTGVISEASFKRTLAAAVDLGAGMKTGPEAGAKTLAKAMADPVKGMAALRRAGIVLNAAEQKRIKDLVKGNKVQEAQGELLTAIEKRYKGAAAASAGPYQRALNLLADASEDAKMALAEGFLPVLEKVADRLSTALADPKTIEDIRGLGKAIAGGFDAVLDASSQIPWDSIKSAMTLAGQGAKAAFDLFTGLPPWVQTAVLTGWGLNKLTGGAVSGIAGELGKGLIRGVLGMNAGVVNINAGVVKGPGGIPGIPGVGAAGGGAAAAGGMGLVAGSAALAAGVAVAALGIMGLGEVIKATSTPERRRQGDVNVRDAARRRYGLNNVPALPGVPEPWRAGRSGGRSPDEREGRRTAGEAAVLERATAAGLKPSADQITRTYNATVARQAEAARSIAVSNALGVAATERSTNRIVAAINGIRIPSPIVNVAAGDIIRIQNKRRRIVKPNGSRGSLVGANEFG